MFCFEISFLQIWDTVETLYLSPFIASPVCVLNFFQCQLLIDWSCVIFTEPAMLTAVVSLSVSVFLMYLREGQAAQARAKLEPIVSSLTGSAQLGHF